MEGGIKDPAPWLKALFSLARSSRLPFLEENDLDEIRLPERLIRDTHLNLNFG